MLKEEKEKIREIERAITDINNARLSYGNAIININSLKTFIETHIRVDSINNISDELDNYKKNIKKHTDNLESIKKTLNSNINNIKNLAKEREQNMDK